MDDDGPLLGIGALARRTGLSVRTVRFWSDAGLVPPTVRSASGHRLYDAAAVARLELVVTLRGLDIGLADVTAVLEGTRSVGEVAAVHVQALDAEIRTLRLRRAVLSSVAARNGDLEAMKLVNDLARLSATERQRIVDDFLAEAFGEGEDRSGIRARMRDATPALPDDPTPEQVDAWVEVAGLVADPAFLARCREMADVGNRADGPWTDDPGAGRVFAAAVGERAGAAVAPGLDPASPAAQEIVRRVLPDADVTERTRLADQLATFTDAQVDRYWKLVGIINGWPAFRPMTPAFLWFIEALRAPAQ